MTTNGTIYIAERSSAPDTPGTGKWGIFPQADGLYLVDDAGNAWRIGPKHNFAATAAPGTGDDADDGYSVGSRWIDTTNDNSYECQDSTVGSAVWAQLDAAAGGGGATTELDNLGTTAVNAHILPGTTNAIDLGAHPSLYFRTGHFQQIRTGRLAWNPSLEEIEIDAAGDADLTSFLGGLLVLAANAGTEDELVSVSNTTFTGTIQMRAAIGDTITITPDGSNIRSLTNTPIVMTQLTLVLAFVGGGNMQILSTQTIDASHVASGTLAHERGGLGFSPAAVAIGDLIAGTGTGTMGLVTSTGHNDGDVLTRQADGSADWEAPSGGTDYICIVDSKAAGTGGGTFTQDAWRTRDLNTEVADAGGHAALSSNQITLAAGTYRFYITAPAFRVNFHKLRLYNVTDTAEIQIGTSEFNANAAAYATTPAFLAGRFTIADTKVLEIQHYCTTTHSTTGLGQAANIDSKAEIYTVAQFWKEA